MTPQRKRRKELEAEWKIVKKSIILRDKDRCIICGYRAVTVNHILSRGSHPELFLEEKNLACLCKEHDSPSTNTLGFVRVQLNILKEKHGYDYSLLPYRGYL